MRVALFTLPHLLVSTSLLARSFPVDAVDPPREGEFPGSRGPDQMIIYTPACGHNTTGTNEWGSEAVVENGVVVSVGTNDSPIPESGFVVSGHGEARNWVNEHLAPGTAVQHDEERVWVDDSVMGQVHALRFRSHEVLARLQAMGASDELVYHADAISGVPAGVGWRHPMQPTPFLLGQVSAEVSRLEERAWALKLAAMPSPEGEVRGVWCRLKLEDVARGDIVALAEELAATHVNVFFPETIYDSHAIYEDPADLYDLHEDLEEVDFDVLDLLIRECHARDIEVHPWVHTFFVGRVEERSEEDKEEYPDAGVLRVPRLAETHPGWLAVDRRGRTVSADEEGYMFFNPAIYQARQAIMEAHVSLIVRYPVDGLHLDYIRYPHSTIWERGWDYGGQTVLQVQDALGFSPLEITPDENPVQWRQWLSWREQQISSFVASDRAMIHELRPHVRITAAVFPGLQQATEVKGQNWARWLSEGLTDAVLPMAYTSDPGDVRAATEEVLAVKSAAPPVVGLAPYLGLSPHQLVEQILVTREAGAQGQCLFSWDDLTDEHRRALVEGPWRSHTGAQWRSATSATSQN